MSLFLPNATADFEREVLIDDTDAWGDPITRADWQTTLEDVPVRYTPSRVREQTSSGEITRRPAQLKAPMRVHDAGHGAGDRVTIHFRGRTNTYRMIEFAIVTAHGSSGTIRAELADWGDTEITA